MSIDNQITRGTYDRLAWIYDALYWPWERIVVGALRQRLFSNVAGGEILEVGIGTGLNIPFHPEGAEITGIDVSPGMLKRAERRAGALGSDVRLVAADIQRLEFNDDKFDGAIGSFVFCSVSDPGAALSELKRVVKPGGEIVLLEHVRIDKAIIGRMMDLMDPLMVRLAGFHINRKTVENVHLTGFEDVTDERYGPFGMVRLIKATVPRK